MLFVLSVSPCICGEFQSPADEMRAVARDIETLPLERRWYAVSHAVEH